MKLKLEKVQYSFQLEEEFVETIKVNSLEEIKDYQKKVSSAIIVYFPLPKPDHEFINKLPEDMLEKIFIHVLFPLNVRFSKEYWLYFDEMFLSLLKQCKKWYRIIMNSNEIWRRIFIIEIIRKEIFYTSSFFDFKEVRILKRNIKMSKKQFKILKDLFFTTEIRKYHDTLCSPYALFFYPEMLEEISYYIEKKPNWYNFINEFKNEQKWVVIIYNGGKIEVFKTKDKIAEVEPYCDNEFCIHEVTCNIFKNTKKQAKIKASKEHFQENYFYGFQETNERCSFHLEELEEYITTFKYKKRKIK